MFGRRKVIRTVSFFSALCIAVAVAGAFSGRAKASYEEKLEKLRFGALNSLCEYTREMSTGLSLLAVSSGDAVADSSAYVSARAAAAIGFTACFDKEKTENINRFLRAVYDLSLNFEENENARKFASEYSDYAEKLYFHLSDISLAVSGGRYSLSEYGSVYSGKKKQCFEDFLDFKTEFAEITQDAVADVHKYGFVASKETVSVDFAKKKACGVVNIHESLWRTAEKTENGITVYSLTHGETEIRVCKAGGSVCYVVNPKPCAKAVYSASDAVSKAENFIRKCGFDADVLLGIRMNDFTADFLFAPKVNGVLLIDSAVSVSVCLASGAITFFNAFDYVENYRSDIYADEEMPDITKTLPESLTAEKVYVAFAEIKGRERLCYLAVCPFDGKKLFVFVDCNEMKVLKIKKYDFTDLF